MYSSRKFTVYSLQFTVNEIGQSLMELVIVIAVMVIVIGALVFATIASLRNAQFAKNQAQATKLAQEGLEWVRTGRDRNACINNTTEINSWNGNRIDTNCLGSKSLWDYQITGGNSDYCNYESTIPTTPSTSTKCYLKISSDGSLQYLTPSTTFPNLPLLVITDSPIFKRAITLSDDPDTFKCAKKVSSIVVWSDFSGDHFSTLTTILRNTNPPAICK